MNQKKQEESIDTEETIKKGMEYLILNQHEDGSIRLGNETRWQVWETANAIIAIDYVDKTQKTFLKKATDFLLSTQRKDGSFYYTLSSEPEEYCMETTASSMLALALLKKDVHKIKEFILKKQQQDGSWEIGIPRIIKYRNWPSVTGHVLKSLLSLNIKSDHIKKGIEFLLQQQQQDGSWGSKWMYYDTPYYCTYVILPAFKLFGLEKSINYQKAIRFIEQRQNSNGCWVEITTDKPRPSESLRTTLALNSLLTSPDITSNNVIDQGIRWLIKEQHPKGYWDGGYFVNWPGKKEDIFTTAKAICALKKYELFKKL